MQSYFGSLPGSDGIPLLEDTHVGQGDVGRPLNIPEPLAQIPIQNSSPTPNAHSQPTMSLQSAPLFGEEDLFMCGRCKQQFDDLQVFLQHKKEGCSIGQRQMQINQDPSLPIIQLSTLPNSHFHVERKNMEQYPNVAVLTNPPQADQTQGIPLHPNPSHCPDETLETSNGLNLTQNSQKDKDLPCEVARDESRFLADAVQQSGLVVNQASGQSQPRSGDNLLLHTNLTPSVPTTGESIMLADDMLTNASPRQIDFNSDLHLPRYPEAEINQQQLNALGMSVLGNGSVASLLQQIPAHSYAPQHQQQISLNSTQQQQQQVYFHIPAPSQPETQKMFAIQPRDASNQNYAVGLNLSTINVTPITLTSSSTIYAVQDNIAQSPLAAENLSKQAPIAPKDGGISLASPKLMEKVNAKPIKQTSSRPKQPSKIYHCKCCPKQFSRTYDLEQHVRSHTGEKPFQCIVCGRAFAQKSNVKKHMETHKVWPKEAMSIIPGTVVASQEESEQDTTAENAEGEKQCETATNQAALLTANARPCPYCSQVLQSYKERKSHMLRHKDKQVYKCVKDGCDQTFPELDDYVEHVKTHEGSMTYRCHHCHKLFDTLQNLGIHQYQAHLNDKSKRGKFGKTYQCKLCPSKFSHPELLQKHMARESHNHRCPFCKKTFVYERYLRKHINVEHSNTPKKRHKCSECGKMMRSVYYLRTHMLIHTKETPFKCEICQASFNRKDNLIRHMVIHDPSKKYKCPFRETLGCQKEFNRPDKLKAHIICHNGIRAHKCSYCPKRYTRKSFKIAHEKTHTDEFRCKICLKGFQNQKALDQHKCRPFPGSETKDMTESHKKVSNRSASVGKTSDLLNLPDEPMYAIRSGSKRRHLRRNASRRLAKSAKGATVSRRHFVKEVPSQDEASTEESEIEVDVEAE